MADLKVRTTYSLVEQLPIILSAINLPVRLRTVSVFSRSLVFCILLSTLTVFPARAQNWSFDARQIALGAPVGGKTDRKSVV